MTTLTVGDGAKALASESKMTDLLAETHGWDCTGPRLVELVAPYG
jgi:hypothetical protein